MLVNTTCILLTVKKPSPVAEPVPSPPKSVGKKSKDGEPKKLEVADDKSAKSASTAKTSTSGTGSKTVTSAKSEEMGEEFSRITRQIHSFV